MVGCCYSGKNHAFVDELVGLFIGPLFVVVEALFAAGLRHDLLRAIEARVGPVRRLNLPRAAGSQSPLR